MANTTTTIPTWTLGDKLRKSRKAAGLSVQEMADLLGVGRNTVTNYERDASKPQPATVAVWAQITGVPASWLSERYSRLSVEELDNAAEVTRRYSRGPNLPTAEELTRGDVRDGRRRVA